MSVDKEVAISKSTQYFGGNEMAASIWVDKYALRDAANELLEDNPDQMHRRLAREFADVEKLYKNPLSESEIYELFKDFKYIIPQGSPMSCIGDSQRYQSLSNCFVVESPEDSYGGICKTDQELAQTMKRRGGVGVDVSTIRPKGMPTTNAARTTDGIVVFMRRFSNTCREVAQGGRRGALMLTCNVHHPDIVEFINSKRDKTAITGANISVMFTGEFMIAVKYDMEYTQRWPLTGEAKFTRKVKARSVWDEFIKATHETAEPGALFIDTVHNGPADAYAPSVSTNPCGEIPLCPYDSCKLMVLNALSFVSNPFSPRSSFDFEKFSSVVFKAQRLMDDLVDLEIAAVNRILKKIEADPEDWSTKKVEYELWQKILLSAIKLRRTGLGLTAIADCLAALGIRYGSARSIEFINGLYKKLATSSWCSSIQLAQERGAFVDYKPGVDGVYANNLISELPEYYRQLHDKHGRRNAAITTTAPAGTISNLACVDSQQRMFGTSSGIEPVFQLSYTRRKKITGTDNLSVDFVDKNGDKWHHFEVRHTAFQYEKDIGATNEDETAYADSTANDIHWLDGIRLQAQAQEWVDHAISRTANIPANTTIEAVAEMYMMAWEHGLKGFTIYRDGCRDGVLVTKPEAKTTFQQHTAPKRPTDLTCDIYHVQINKEPWVVFVGLLEGKPYEIMAGTKEAIGLGKSTGGKDAGVIRKNSHGKQNATYSLLDSAGGCIIPDISAACGSPLHAAFSRTISLSLRHGADVSFLVEQLVKGAKEESSMQAYSKVVARVLKGYIPNNTKSTEKQCPQCSCDNLVFMEGCVTCTACGYSKCS